ncbi:MAG: SusC/RagA family TonB-linked outer membrane protein [Nonlabens sp.]
MKTKFNGILTLLLALVAQVAFAQQTVTGTVTDPDGEPIFGATVQVKGTQTFAQTDFDGKYSVQAGAEDTLVFQFPGYDNQEIVVGSQTNIDTIMKTALDKVVVVGYRTTSKPRSNVAATTITADDIVDRPNASVIQRLQGQIPGLTVQTNSGQPGANSLIRLRGISSINGNTEPLIIVDGVPVDEDAFRTFNPNDIETTTVLKDAAATAIYGNRGANGVIVITTRQGKFDSPLTVSYSAQTAFSELIDTEYNLYDAQGYLRLEQRQGQGLGSTLSDAEIANFTVQENWTDTFFRVGRSQQHNLALRSGGSNVSQFTSINYTKQEGSLQASDLQRFNVRSNINGKSKDDRFAFNTNLSLGFSKNNSQTEPESTTNRNNFIYFNSIFNANNGLPYLDPANYATRIEEWVNTLDGSLSPYVTLDNILFNTNREDELKLIVGGNASYKITDDLTVRYTIGMDYTSEVGLRVADPNGALPRVRASFIAPDAVEGFQTETYFRDFRFNSNLNLSYRKKFGQGTEDEKKHTLLANLYVEYVKGHFKSFNYSQTGLNPRTFDPGNGAGFIADNAVNDEFVPTVGAAKASTGLFSYFGEFDYDYDNTYGFTATVRRDASSRFVEDNRWGTFWSVAGRWNIDQEEFMNNVGWVNTLKLRASYGTAGNDRITGGYYGALNNFRTLFGTGDSYNDQQTFVRTQIGNPNLRWETIKTANIGLEFGLFENRLRGTLEVYDKKTEDLFFNRFVSLVNGTGSILANLGDITNQGVELGIRYNVLRAQSKDDLGIEVFANVNYNRNEVDFVDLPDGLQDNGTSVIQVGEQINEFFVVPYVGVNPANGNLLFQDINGNLTESPTLDDRRLTGTDTNPDFQGGFGFNLDYKNFFFETQFNFMTGLSRFDGNLANYYDISSLGQFQLSSDLDRAWTPDNRVTDIPSLSATNSTPGVGTDRFLKDSDFVRLRFIQIGYQFDQDTLERSFLDSARIYVNAENLVTWTEWLGTDPESTRLTESNRYPTPRTVSIGLDLNF